MQAGTSKHLSLLKTKKRVILKIFFFILLIFCWFSFNTNREQRFSNDLNQFIYATVQQAATNLDSVGYYLQHHRKPEAIRHYERSRYSYKQVEYYLEYHFPFYSKYFINSALVNKAEAEYGYKTFVPHGYQVIESYLYSNDPDSLVNIPYELSLMKQTFGFITEKIPSKSLKQGTTIDMLRFELVRIMSLYLNGYDCTINKQNLKETTSILSGFEKTISFVEASETDRSACFKIIQSSKTYLLKNNDYDSFDRLCFISGYLKPLYESLYELYSKEDKAQQVSYAINIRRKPFYDKKWLNTAYFSVVLKDSLCIKDQIELGKLLFFDPVLSGNNQRACASCHNPGNAFGGSADFNKAFGETTKLKRNTPSLLNAVFQKSFFYDGRSLQLEDQASDVLSNHQEMFSVPEDIVHKLKQSEGYKRYFRKAFKNTEDTLVTYYGILKAISEYERTLVSLDSRFDKYLRGDVTQLSKAEIKGYTVFSGKALCGSCHFFPLFNGLVPPFYSDNEFEVIGVPKNMLNKELDPDSGRYHLSKNKIHLNSFRTPGIRNIDKTAPYMHNGVFNTVDEVIDFYKKGGGEGLGLKVPNQTLPFDSLQLTKQEISSLKKFLLSLTDKGVSYSAPLSLPLIQIKGLEVRKVGGYY